MRIHRRSAAFVVAVVAAVSIGAPTVLPAQATEAPSGAVQGAVPEIGGGEDHPSAVPPADRKKIIGGAFDRAWTTSGDASGFHVLVADAKNGYGWKTAASLSEPGFDTDAWIGNACLTESGERAVVAYAPRTFTNKPELMARGAFAAVVELATGKVTKLPVQVSLAYFSPGCGEGEQAVLSQFTDESMAENATRLVTVDAADGKTQKPLKLTGQITSAIPYGKNEVVAADGARLVKIGKDGSRKPIASTDGVPFQLTKDAAGGVTFLDKSPKKDKAGKVVGQVRHLAAAAFRTADGKARPQLVATGELNSLDLAASASGEVYVTGKAAGKGKAPAHVHNPGGLAKDTRMSTRGQAAVASAWADGKASQIRPDEALTERTVATSIKVLETGQTAKLNSVPGRHPVASNRMNQGRQTTPALPKPVEDSAAAKSATQPQPGVKTMSAGRVPIQATAQATTRAAASGGSNSPVDDPRVCSVPRNDIVKQAFQPTPRQVEWAVDQAVINGLNKWIERPGEWKSMAMGAYRPQDLFPIRPLLGDPNGVVDRADEWHIPAQILLGITAQESNMWQATRFAVPGVTANSLIGNFYGIEYAADGDQGDAWAINWAKADCGYGITQITDGMRLPGHGQPTLSTAQQEAAALDYTANIAAGADKLAEKWNQTRSAGLIINDGKPKYIENWYFALWAYNAGFYEQSAAPDNGGTWGVGFTNNPANPLWKANRTPFLEASSGADDYSHAAHPQDWPYQEKVMGWAARPLSAMFAPGDMQAGFRPAWWTTNADRTTMKAPEGTFCDSSNECDPSKIGPDDKNEPGLGACNRSDLHCWWNKAATWKSCDTGHCGNAIHRFNNTDYPEQPDATTSYAPRCSGGLPAGSLIVDDVPDTAWPAGSRCARGSSAGSFEFSYKDVNGIFPGKIDTHQVGAGYGNHFWFTHTRKDGAEGDRLETTGTWRLGQELNGWTRILVHLPDHGAHTQQAEYEIDLGNGYFSQSRFISQKRKANEWVSLGVYQVSGTPRVRLSSETEDGDGSEDVAWDAVGFQPLPGKPKEIVAVLGDSYTSGEGAGDYLKETNSSVETKSWNACRRSQNSWSRKTTMPGTSGPLGQLADGFDPSVELQNVSCSGAHTWNGQVGAGDPMGSDGNIHWDWDGSFREKSQMDSGALTSDTTLVTLSIGGNDAGFPTVLQECATLGCPPDDEVKADIDTAVDGGVASVLQQIHNRAPNAKIVLMGYPKLFNTDVTLCVSGVGGIGMIRLNELGRHMDTKQRELAERLKAQGLPVTYESPDADFEGKRACDSPEGINKIVTGQNGDGDFICKVGGTWCVSRESYHPNQVGTTAYSAAFLRAVNKLNAP
ncbi:GDSL-type esterase/lipase family protein [Streptomyces sp. NPDC051563]|uniref:GDSL-type esterase/lipase family protein n=1 Tax=Streptomyces sp. NPDC051563 TaxID=3365659 RepID=UPI0037A61E43